MKEKDYKNLQAPRRKILLVGGAVTLVGLASGTAVYFSEKKSRPLDKEITRPDDASGQSFIEYAIAPRYLGVQTAPIQVVEFFSMTCSHCASFHRETFPLVKKRLIDENILRFEMRAFPLDGLALRAHAIARSLPLSQYYPMVDILMKNQRSWTTAEDPISALRKLARRAGLSGVDFDAVLKNRQLLESIVEMRQEASLKWEVKSTPSFVINNQTVISGSLSFDEFAKKINATGA